MKIKCSKCDKMATWCYMPGHGTGNYLDNFKCDDHVYRGCTCNEHVVEHELSEELGLDLPNEEWIEGKDWEWMKEGYSWRDLDGEGRQLPCCEYWYDKEGFDEE